MSSAKCLSPANHNHLRNKMGLKEKTRCALITRRRNSREGMYESRRSSEDSIIDSGNDSDHDDPVGEMKNNVFYGCSSLQLKGLDQFIAIVKEGAETMGQDLYEKVVDRLIQLFTGYRSNNIDIASLNLQEDELNFLGQVNREIIDQKTDEKLRLKAMECIYHVCTSESREKFADQEILQQLIDIIKKSQTWSTYTIALSLILALVRGDGEEVTETKIRQFFIDNDMVVFFDDIIRKMCQEIRVNLVVMGTSTHSQQMFIIDSVVQIMKEFTSTSYINANTGVCCLNIAFNALTAAILFDFMYIQNAASFVGSVIQVLSQDPRYMEVLAHVDIQPQIEYLLSEKGSLTMHMEVMKLLRLLPTEYVVLRGLFYPLLNVAINGKRPSIQIEALDLLSDLVQNGPVEILTIATGPLITKLLSDVMLWTSAKVGRACLRLVRKLFSMKIGDTVAENLKTEYLRQKVNQDNGISTLMFVWYWTDQKMYQESEFITSKFFPGISESYATADIAFEKLSESDSRLMPDVVDGFYVITCRKENVPILFQF